jgi:multiple sugar transport system permease protein
MATTTNQTIPTVLPVAKSTARRPGQNMEQRQQRWGMIFISPWVIGFLLFTAGPMIASFYFSFTDFNLGSPDAMHWVGLRNWQTLFSDPDAIQGMITTIKFALIAVPFGLAMPLGLASLLTSKWLVGKRLLTTLFYMPYMVPSVSGVFIWMAFMNADSGWLNRILRLVGMNPPNWLQNEATVLPAFLLMGVWGVGNAMLTMMATMSGVPTELYEAASVDGAGPFTKWRKITVPMISPVIFYNLVLSVIGLMQYFNIPYIATNGTGDPNKVAFFYNMLLFKTAFGFFKMGLASAMAWLLFLVALVFTLILFGTSRRWVYYGGE